jgi:predicted metal-dependent enzyme (double-stranded beta helix superfamily)
MRHTRRVGSHILKKNFDAITTLGDDLAAQMGATARPFHQLATDALERSQLDERVDAHELLMSVASLSSIASQADLDSDFGEPALTLYSHPDFRIDALWWNHGTTSIHEHGFSGAFMVLQGTSFHTTFSFDAATVLMDSFMTGVVRRTRIELLSRGTVRTITAGSSLIHSVFHLGSPNVTLVVRTHRDDDVRTQFTYDRPFVAYNPYAADPLRIKRGQVLDLLLATRHPDVEAFTRSAMAGDIHTCYELLRRVYKQRSRLDGAFPRLLDAAGALYGEAVNLFVESYKVSMRELRIIALRESVHDEDLRYFLACLLTLDDRASIYEAIGWRFPDRPPQATITDMLTQLPDLGVTMTDVNRLIVSMLLNDATPDVISGALGEHVNCTRAELAQKCDQIRSLAALQPLFAVSATS